MVQLLLITIVLTLSACAPQAPLKIDPLVLPTTFSRSGNQPLAGEWWRSFADPLLNDLVQQALADNLSLKTGWDRLSQARALHGKSRAGLFPSLDGQSSAEHQQNRISGSSEKSDTLLLGLSAGYELDLWGKIDSSVAAARMDMEAQVADLDAVAMSLSAEVAVCWYELVALEQALRLLDEQLATNQQGVELVAARFRTGLVPMEDLLQQRQLVAATQGRRLLQLAERTRKEHQLTILLGLAPGTRSFQIPTRMIALPTLPDTGVPGELLLARPDIRSAFQEVAAADQRVAGAAADRFPALRLSASLQSAGSGAALLSDYLTSLAAGLTGPILDGGSREQELERTRAVAAEKLHLYGQAILEALGEVEDALVIEEQQLHYIQSLDRQRGLAEQTMLQIKERYLKGSENYQRVLSALISLQGLQQDQLVAHRDLLVNRIRLCRALGRGWGYSQGQEKI
ncbi:efflux transporter outer membrane subunit [Desulfogranum mediterraneum]|uniref:efflux transporter outer membrane subunit n=1 Tax=Desulfogranum mediterraneum TaxID=160661 RepID=UPI000686AB2E|nr:TolC family protein [Desulfogranum mediterraneum]